MTPEEIKELAERLVDKVDSNYRDISIQVVTMALTSALNDRWVNPQEELPKDGQQVWFVSGGALNRGRFYPLDQWYRPNMFIADSGGFFTSSPQGNETYTHPVTHWMSMNIPSPPTK